MVEVDPILGNPKVCARMDLHKVKGSLLAARPRFLRERWGEHALRAVAERLDGEPRRLLLGQIFLFEWYPMSIMAAIDRVIVQGPMHGDASMMKEFGSVIAKYHLPTIYKVFFKLGTPSFVIKRLNMAYKTYISGGSLAIDVPSPQNVIVTFHGAFPKYLCTYGIPGWVIAALELSGARRANVNEVACIHEGSPHCQWRGNWS